MVFFARNQLHDAQYYPSSSTYTRIVSDAPRLLDGASALRQISPRARPPSGRLAPRRLCFRLRRFQPNLLLLTSLRAGMPRTQLIRASFPVQPSRSVSAHRRGWTYRGQGPQPECMRTVRRRNGERDSGPAGVAGARGWSGLERLDRGKPGETCRGKRREKCGNGYDSQVES